MKYHRALPLLLVSMCALLILNGCGLSTPTGKVPTATVDTSAPVTSQATIPPEASTNTSASAAMEQHGASITQVASATTAYQHLSGAITIDGSSTVEPLTRAIAEQFTTVAPNVQVTVKHVSTGDGFKKFCNGEIDANDASRPIKDEELQACRSKGITPKEIFLGLDGISVVVSPNNNFVQDLTFQQLNLIFKQDGAKTWNEVDPSFPNEPIAKFGPAPGSGTLDFFKEKVGLTGEKGQPSFTTDYTSSTENDTRVQDIEKNSFAIGFFGYSFYEQEQERRKQSRRAIFPRIVPIAETDSARRIKPTAQTVEDGSYPLARPLFIYPSAEALAKKPELAAFLRFYLDHVRDVILDVGYFPGSDQRYEEAKQRLTEQ